MCHENFKIFRISNRGTNLYEQVANQRYAVNVPSELRDPTKTMKIEVVDGTIACITDATFKTFMELGIQCNFTNGFDTENSGGFNCKNMENLFNVDINNYTNAGISVPFKKSSNNSFLLNQIPEKLIFNRYCVINNNVIPLTFDGYVSFTLKITYYDKN
jgi:hypothetical protein